MICSVFNVYPKNSYFLLLLVLFSSTSILSQVHKDTISLSEVILQATPIKNSVQKSASSVSIINSAAINKTDAVVLTPILNKIPGVFMQQGAMNTNRISIRGIGARTPYGTNRIKAYFDMIPLTSGEGESVIDDIDITTIEKIEIIKGPNSSSFGSGLGGVIHLFSKEAPSTEVFGKSNTTYGSFGLLQQRFSGGYNKEKSTFFSSYSTIDLEGFRANSTYKRKNFNLFGKQQLSSKGTLSFVGMFTKVKAFIPSSLSEKDFNDNPEKAATTWSAAQGFESYDKYILGLGYKHLFSEKWSLQSSFFSNFKNAYEARPFDILEEKTRSFGLRLHVNYKEKLFSMPFEFSFGTEIATEEYEYSLYKNEYLAQAGKGSIQGDKFSNKLENRNYCNYFLQLEIELTKRLHLETGFAINSTQYSLKDLFQSTAITGRQNDTFGSIESPRIGFSYSLAKGKNMYTSVSKGFSIPTVAESLTPDGNINTNLKAEMGWNYEMGFKGNWLANKIYSELIFFSTQIQNLLVARRTANDQYVGVNAGSSSHPGLEFLVNYTMLETQNWQISSSVSGGLNRFKFKDFVDGDANYSGNQLTNVPSSQLNFGLDISTKQGFSVNTSYRILGKTPMNDANTKYTDSFALLDVKTSYTFKILQRIKAELYAGINNALNEKYAASIVPNAQGFGTAPPRYYYPGNPVNYFGGFSVSYLF